MAFRDETVIAVQKENKSQGIWPVVLVDLITLGKALTFLKSNL